MSIPSLKIIGERINPGFAKSKAMLDGGDISGLQELARSQTAKGCDYLTINIGDRAERDSGFLVDVIQAAQAVSHLPLSFDYPNRAVQEICLKAWQPAKAQGRKPIVNSISELRWDMLDVLKITPAKVVLMASERMEDGQPVPNETPTEIASTVHRMVHNILSNDYGLGPEDLFVDVSLTPIAMDTNGLVRRAIEAIRLIGADADLRGIHLVVGLSNLGIMLPKVAVDGSPLPVKIESAFLTLTMPHGLDTVLGTPGRDYRILPPDDFVLQGFQQAIALEGFDTLERIRRLYQRDEG